MNEWSWPDNVSKIYCWSGIPWCRPESDCFLCSTLIRVFSALVGLVRIYMAPQCKFKPTSLELKWQNLSTMVVLISVFASAWTWMIWGPHVHLNNYHQLRKSFCRNEWCILVNYIISVLLLLSFNVFNMLNLTAHILFGNHSSWYCKLILHRKQRNLAFKAASK